jgi:membrane protease YdiL (CAAX protease family)
VGGATALALAVAVVPIGLSEELMYRGLVLRALRDRFPEVAAATVTAMLSVSCTCRVAP